MTTQEMNELMSTIISRHASIFGGGAAKKTALKLAAASIEDRITVAGQDAYALAISALSRCGKLLEQDDGSQTLAGLIMAGAADMNPAIVVLTIEDGSIHISATAKEGLIKQHTAEKAIAKFKAASALPAGAPQ